MKVSEFIAKLDRLMPNTFGTEEKIDWINYVEEYVFTTIIKKLLKVEIPLKADVASYAMEGYKFDQIEAIHVDDVPYAKRAENNYIERSFYLSEGKIALCPVPVRDGEMKVFYRYLPTPKTVAGAAEEELEILSYGNQFLDLYLYYCFSKICWFQKEYEEYNNQAVQYNVILNDLSKYIFHHERNDEPANIKNYW